MLEETVHFLKWLQLGHSVALTKVLQWKGCCSGGQRAPQGAEPSCWWHVNLCVIDLLQDAALYHRICQCPWESASPRPTALNWSSWDYKPIQAEWHTDYNWVDRGDKILLCLTLVLGLLEWPSKWYSIKKTARSRCWASHTGRQKEFCHLHLV